MNDYLRGLEDERQSCFVGIGILEDRVENISAQILEVRALQDERQRCFVGIEILEDRVESLTAQILEAIEADEDSRTTITPEDFE